MHGCKYVCACGTPWAHARAMRTCHAHVPCARAIRRQIAVCCLLFAFAFADGVCNRGLRLRIEVGGLRLLVIDIALRITDCGSVMCSRFAVCGAWGVCKATYGGCARSKRYAAGACIYTGVRRRACTAHVRALAHTYILTVHARGFAWACRKQYSTLAHMQEHCIHTCMRMPADICIHKSTRARTRMRMRMCTGAFEGRVAIAYICVMRKH
jgi:hypothetical protein